VWQDRLQVFLKIFRVLSANNPAFEAKDSMIHDGRDEHARREQRLEQQRQAGGVADGSKYFKSE
jgi:hypothetical protein